MITYDYFAETLIFQFLHASGSCPECMRPMPAPGVFATTVGEGFGGGAFGSKTPDAAVASAPAGPSYNAEPVGVPRAYFPETWLWELFTMPLVSVVHY